MLSGEYVKQYLLEELQKAIKKLAKMRGSTKGSHAGLVQVERTVNKKGTIFTQKFWIKPDQNKSIKPIVKTVSKDNFWNPETQDWDAKKELSLHYDGSYTSIIDKSGNMDDYLKRVTTSILNDRLQKEAAGLLSSLSTNTKKGVNFPSSMDFYVSVKDMRMDGETNTITFQYVSPFNVEEVDSDTEKWLSSAIWSNSIGGKRTSNVTNVKGKWAVEITTTCDWWKDDYKEWLYKTTQARMQRVVQDSLINDKSSETAIKSRITINPSTNREKDKFGSIINTASISQLKDYRTLGICAGDTKASDWLHNLCANYIVSSQTMNLSSTDLKTLLASSVSDVKAILNGYEDKLSDTINSLKGKGGYVENNEIKTKVSTVTPEEFTQLSNQIADDWDNDLHGHIKYKIHGIYKVEDMPVEEDYNSILEENKDYEEDDAGGKNCHEDIFYHGTGSVATCNILGHSGQFEINKIAKCGRMLGDGIYLADKSSKSAQYIQDLGFSRKAGRGTLMICTASLGDCLFDPEEDEEEDIDYAELGDGYDSMGLSGDGSINNAEWCVYNAQAVKPKYLVDLEILPTE